METEVKNIQQALAMVMSHVGYVQKKKQGGVTYTFASERDFIAAIRPYFVEYGIVVYPRAVKELRLDAYHTSRGASMNRASVIMEYEFTHAPSATAISVSVCGEGADIGDKSINKAMTDAYKYALREALMIETGDDPDEDPSEGPDPEEVKEYTDEDRERMGGAFARRVTSIPERPGLSDAGKKRYWDSLGPAERAVYSDVANLIPKIIEECPRYENRFSAEKAMAKLFPTLADKKNWPKTATPDDGQMRVTIFRTVKAYGQLRNQGMGEKQALAEAFSTARNLNT